MNERRVLMLATPSRGLVTCEQRMGALLLQQDLLAQASAMKMTGWADGRDHLITARNVLLHQALDQGVDLLVWLDADCAPGYSQPDTLYAFLRAAAQTDGILGARAVRRGGGWNCVGDNYDDARPHLVEAIGLDFCVYNLRWFRGAFARCEREHSSTPCRPTGPPRPHFFEWWGGVGEDYRACEWVRAHGGEVALDPRMPTWHDGRVWTGIDSNLVLQ